MKTTQEIAAIIAALKELYPDAACSLDYVKDYELLFTKSLLDGVSSCMLSVSLGLGVLFSSVPVFVYQGLLALLAHVIAPLLSDAAIAEITCCGSVMILAIGLNMLHLTKIKTADLLPAVLFAPVLTWAFSFLPL